MKNFTIVFAVILTASALGYMFFVYKNPTTEPVPQITRNDVHYINASENLIKVELPFPGAVVGKDFSVIGEARGTWFFEASFPIKVVGAKGEILAAVPATAQGEWMTENFVPFRANIKIPETYIGPAKLILQKDNPSGLPEHDASVSFDFIIEY